MIHILSMRLYSEDDEKFYIGGIETYVITLSRILKSEGYEVINYQYSDHQFDIEKDEIKIIGLGHCKLKKAISFIESHADLNNDILILSSSTLLAKNNFKRSIAIQHGVHWDVPIINRRYLKGKYGSSVYLYLRSLREFSRLEYVNKIVCVDYNYINWYRSHTNIHDVNYEVIPNFSHENNYKREDEDEKIRIIFARRFEKIRGTELLCKVLPRIMNDFQNVELLIAGNGSQAEELHTVFDDIPNVRFECFSAEDSMKIHAKYDIALIPTIGSEGTSLSLLEAMASGCAVICTDVGGMSNIVLDGFNGIIIKPSETDLYDALCKLINNKELRLELSSNAICTIKKSFSFAQWKNKWIKVINSLNY